MMMANATNASSYASMNKQHIARTSPRNNTTLRANGAKIAIPQEENVKGQVKRVEEWIGDAQVSLREYKKEIEMLRQEIGLMENHLST